MTEKTDELQTGSACLPRPGSALRAFAVECRAWEPPVTSVIRTTSAARAKFRAWDSARDVGYKVEFSDFRVKRAPQFDGAKLIKDRCYGLDFAESVISPNAGGLAREALPAPTG
jgi:hypothetical protein